LTHPRITSKSRTVTKFETLYSRQTFHSWRRA